MWFNKRSASASLCMMLFCVHSTCKKHVARGIEQMVSGFADYPNPVENHMLKGFDLHVAHPTLVIPFFLRNHGAVKRFSRVIDSSSVQ